MQPVFRGAAANAQWKPGGRLGWARGAVGALIGIALAGLVTQLCAKSGAPWLVAPLGASAVLVFAVPASPLAQPWSVLGGNMLSAAIGLAFGHAIGAPWLAASLAVGTAIAVMTLTRCLHPPGGACALLCALGANASGLSAGFLLVPLLPNLVLLIFAGWVYNGLTGHPWPHRAHPAPTLPAGTWAGTYESADLDAVLEEWDEVLDVEREDLDALFREVEQRVLKRWQNGGR
ncbi:HPP family protein [Novosphingobium sp. KCTC 2891]|uniref:HPP family protein n=1 Tax=Novosphingobium sp. KCTC 2891 TaxID=2989730 RepID=UPI0022225287|nr:HPP family protein [Novosphingobium sp. KCTC 2891]MCW1382059.1 HPP family protein [Novosphingobium sp. KCTC 2891]